ncbi:MAG: hypothetical protein PWP49_1243 [Thermococcaceae archaeon]|nr:hypothetical protein [Thermococcaceae archaeon]MDN5320823.1 hypothetical protein [Thermococcaceae archaeon]
MLAYEFHGKKILSIRWLLEGVLMPPIKNFWSQKLILFVNLEILEV